MVEFMNKNSLDIQLLNIYFESNMKFFIQKLHKKECLNFT
jgi:hypothetical protein